MSRLTKEVAVETNKGAGMALEDERLKKGDIHL